MPGPERRPPTMLRASCDRCHQAKVRCIFNGASACIRCQQRNSKCVRSPPMPLGRTRGSKNKRKDSGSTTSSTSGGESPPDRIEKIERMDHMEHHIERMDTPPSLMGDTTPPPPPPQATFDQLSNPDLSYYGGSQPDTTLDHDFAAAGMDWPGADILFPPPMPLISELPTPSPPAEALVHMSDDGYTCSPDPKGDLMLCSCSSAVTEMLMEVQHASSETSAAFDQVLKRNKTALAVIGQFLNCPQSHGFPLVLLVYFLVQKILSTYQDVWWSWCNSKRRYEQQRMRTPHFPNASQQIRIGSYTITEEDCPSLRQHIIIMEVRKVASFLSSLGERTHDRDERGYDRTFVFVRTFLSNEVDGIIRRMLEAEA